MSRSSSAMSPPWLAMRPCRLIGSMRRWCASTSRSRCAPPQGQPRPQASATSNRPPALRKAGLKTDSNPPRFPIRPPTKATQAMSETQQTEHLPIVEGILTYLIDERHSSPYTSRCYGVDLRQYIDYLAEELNITVNRQQESEAMNRRRQSRADTPMSDGVLGKVGPATITNAMFDADVNLIRA